MRVYSCPIAVGIYAYAIPGYIIESLVKTYQHIYLCVTNPALYNDKLINRCAARSGSPHDDIKIITLASNMHMHAFSLWRSPDALLFYFTLQEENLNEQIAETNLNYPYTIAVISMDFSVNMFLVVERETVCTGLFSCRQYSFYCLCMF